MMTTEVKIFTLAGGGAESRCLFAFLRLTSHSSLAFSLTCYREGFFQLKPIFSQLNVISSDVDRVFSDILDIGLVPLSTFFS